MKLDFEACWRASSSRDARFDGRFFVGVTTTGIYCRPICPAPAARRENVRFYPTAAAAAEAGLRPCRRCRPEAAPGTPEWLGGSALATRALRLIAGGCLDSGSVGGLAATLCVSDRQLRRLFRDHFGAGPLAVARARRLTVARMLIDQTGLSMAAIARESGYRSVRQFNAEVRRAFGRTPTALRDDTRDAASDNELVLRLSYRPPYAWRELLLFLDARAIPGVEAVHRSQYRRTVRLADGPAMIRIEDEPARHRLTLRVRPPSVDGIALVVERSRRLADLDADPLAVGEALGADPLLRSLVARRPGLRVPGAWDRFELAVRAILGQQVSVAAATTLAGRLVRAFGEPLAEPDGPLTHLFPLPAVLAEADVGSVGMPQARANAIRALARAAAGDGAFLDGRDGVARLLELPGVGPWTAQYIAMRALGDPDALPSSDLGLRYALGTNGAAAAPAEVGRRGEAWRPWRSYAVMHLWLAEGDPLEAAA